MSNDKLEKNKCILDLIKNHIGFPTPQNWPYDSNKISSLSFVKREIIITISTFRFGAKNNCAYIQRVMGLY